MSDEIIKKVKFGGVFVNGKVLKNANVTLNLGDEVKMILPPDKTNSYIASILEFSDIYIITYADISTGEVNALLIDGDIDKFIYDNLFLNSFFILFTLEY